MFYIYLGTKNPKNSHPNLFFYRRNQLNSIASFAKVNSGRSTLKAEITLCPCIPLPFQTEKDGSHISMTHAFSSTFFGFSLWLPENFGLFYCFSRLYVHFLLPGSVFPSGFRMFLDFFLLFLCFMSIFSCPAPYFPLASGWFWTFSLFFSLLCPYGRVQKSPDWEMLHWGG